MSDSRIDLDNRHPRLWRPIRGTSALVGLTGMLCCVAPMVLIMTGLMGATFAISFADAFYTNGGETGIGAWVLRGSALPIGIAAFVLYRAKMNRCSLDPRRKILTLALFAVMVAVPGMGCMPHARK